MRNPNRLDNFYTILCKVHKESFPDLRFGQLMSNFFSWLMQEKGIDCFFPEEDKMADYIIEYRDSFKRKQI